MVRDRSCAPVNGSMMLMNETINGCCKTSFAGGALLSIWHSISFAGVIETVVYSIIGTLVSFIISYLLRLLFKSSQKKNR